MQLQETHGAGVVQAQQQHRTSIVNLVKLALAIMIASVTAVRATGVPASSVRATLTTPTSTVMAICTLRTTTVSRTRTAFAQF